MNGTNFINGICKALHISITLICIWYMDTNYLKLQVVCNCSKVAAYKRIVFRQCWHQAVVLGFGYTVFTFEVVLTSSASYIKPFKATVCLAFSVKMKSISKLQSPAAGHLTAALTYGSQCFDSYQLPVDNKNGQKWTLHLKQIYRTW